MILNDIEEEMNKIIVERREVIRGLMCALLVKEHLFVVGPTGTAKSEMIRLLADSIIGASRFDVLMTKFTTPEEIVGPIKFSSMKMDKFERATDGYLPEVHLAFIDEIWKASSSILNTLLTMLNERYFKVDGEMRPIKLETCMSASNEIPHDREELVALWDRLLLRYNVGYIKEDGSYIDMLAERINNRRNNITPTITNKLTLDQLHKMQSEVKSVDISDEIPKIMAEIRKSIKAISIEPSDRRYDHLLKVAQAEAYMNGRMEVTDEDLEILKYGLWEKPSDISKINIEILKLLNPLQEKADELYDAIISSYSEIEEAEEKKRSIVFIEWVSKSNKAVSELEDIAKILDTKNKNTRKIKDYLAYIEKLKVDGTTKYFRITLK
jgi:MoxR-like ATPase